MIPPGENRYAAVSFIEEKNFPMERGMDNNLLPFLENPCPLLAEAV